MPQELIGTTFNLNMVINDFIRTSPAGLQHAIASGLHSDPARAPSHSAWNTFHEEESEEEQVESDNDDRSTKSSGESEEDHVAEMLAIEEAPPPLLPSGSDLANLDALVAEWEAGGSDGNPHPLLEPTFSELKDLEGLVAEFEASSGTPRSVSDDNSPFPSLYSSPSDLLALEQLDENHSAVEEEGDNRPPPSPAQQMWQVVRDFFSLSHRGEEAAEEGASHHTPSPAPHREGHSPSERSDYPAPPSPPPSPPLGWWPLLRSRGSRAGGASGSNVGLPDVVLRLNSSLSSPTPPPPRSARLESEESSRQSFHAPLSRSSSVLHSVREDQELAVPEEGSIRVVCSLHTRGIETEDAIFVRLRLAVVTVSAGMVGQNEAEEKGEEGQDGEEGGGGEDDSFDVFFLREKAERQLLRYLNLEAPSFSRGPSFSTHRGPSLSVSRGPSVSLSRSTSCFPSLARTPSIPSGFAGPSLTPAQLEGALDLMSTKELRDVLSLLQAGEDSAGVIDLLTSSNSSCSKKLLFILLLAPSIHAAAASRSAKERTADPSHTLRSCWAACRPLTSVLKSNPSFHKPHTTPKQFIEDVISAATPHVLLAARLKPLATPYLRRAGLSWADAAPSSYANPGERAAWYTALAEPENNLLTQVFNPTPTHGRNAIAATSIHPSIPKSLHSLHPLHPSLPHSIPPSLCPSFSTLPSPLLLSLPPSLSSIPLLSSPSLPASHVAAWTYRINQPHSLWLVGGGSLASADAGGPAMCPAARTDETGAAGVAARRGGAGNSGGCEHCASNAGDGATRCQPAGGEGAHTHHHPAAPARGGELERGGRLPLPERRGGG